MEKLVNNFLCISETKILKFHGVRGSWDQERALFPQLTWEIGF